MSRPDTLGRWLRSWPGLCAIAAFVLTRVGLLFLYVPSATDLRIYWTWVVQAASGRVAFADFPVEYPPLAWWVMVLPSTTDKIAYYFRFRALMAATDVSAFALLLWVVARRRGWALTGYSWLYVATTVILAHELYDRLDIGVLFFVALGMAAWLAAQGAVPVRRGAWLAAAYAIVGLGAAYKLFPLVLAPFLAISEAQAGARPRAILARLSLCLAVAAAPLAFTYGYAGSGTFEFLRYHGVRGIEIESCWASVMWLLSFLGRPVHVAIRHGSWELRGPLEAVVLTGASAITFVYVVWLLVWSYALGARFTPERSLTQALLALGGLLIVSKVFSPQYLLWGIPVMALVGAEVSASPRQFRVIAALLVACAVLTAVVYPTGRREIGDLRAWIMGALLARNVAYACVWLWLARACFTLDRRGLT